jgi:hypothetical protein
MRRLVQPEDLAQVGAAVLEAQARARDQELQVVARVGIEHPQDLVRMDVLDRLRDVERLPLLERPPAARVELEEHVLERRLRPQERGRLVRHEPLVLGVDLHLDHRAAVHQLDLAYLADLHAGYAHGLPLSRRDGLRGRQLGLQRDRRLLDQREAQPLVGDDVGADPQADRHERDQQQESGQVAPDRVPHGSATL